MTKNAQPIIIALTAILVFTVSVAFRLEHSTVFESRGGVLSQEGIYQARFGGYLLSVPS